MIEDKETMDYNVGVPQGSSLEPSLWLLVVNEILRKVKDNINVRFVVFADDVLILFREKSSFHFIELVKEPFNVLLDWSSRFKLKFNLNKSLFTMMKTGKNTNHIQRIKFNQCNIKYRDKLKYLEVIYDRNYT